MVTGMAARKSEKDDPNDDPFPLLPALLNRPWNEPLRGLRYQMTMRWFLDGQRHEDAYSSVKGQKNTRRSCQRFTGPLTTTKAVISTSRSRPSPPYVPSTGIRVVGLFDGPRCRHHRFSRPPGEIHLGA